MDLFFIRHAQSANNAVAEEDRVPDPGLTEIGQLQARHLADAVEALEVSRVITSPFRRTLETTREVHRVTGLAPYVHAELFEQGGCYSGYASVGRRGQPGMTRQQIESEFTNYIVDQTIDHNGWWKCREYETWDAAKLRAQAVLTWLRQEFADRHQRVAIIMHADFKTLLLHEMQANCLAIPYNASLSHVQISANDFRLVEFNDVAHLPDELLTS